MSTYSYLNIGASRPGVSWGFNGSPPQRCCLPSGCSMPSVCRPLVCHIPLQLGIESPGRGVVGFIFRTYFLGSSILWNILENPWTGLIELNFHMQELRLQVFCLSVFFSALAWGHRLERWNSAFSREILINGKGLLHWRTMEPSTSVHLVEGGVGHCPGFVPTEPLDCMGLRTFSVAPRWGWSCRRLFDQCMESHYLWIYRELAIQAQADLHLKKSFIWG